MYRDPQLSLMLNPLGALWMTSTSAPNSAKAWGATL